MADADEYFTLVFKGNLRKLRFNPHKAETVFGMPVAVSMGDALAPQEICRTCGRNLIRAEQATDS